MQRHPDTNVWILSSTDGGEQLLSTHASQTTAGTSHRPVNQVRLIFMMMQIFFSDTEICFQCISSIQLEAQEAQEAQRRDDR